MKNVNFAIIGTGSIVELHIESIKEIDNATVVALCSSNEARAKEAEEKYNIPCYSSLASLFANEKIDAISICTYSGNHLEPCVEAAKRGIHVITEKPLEVTLDRADQMINACKENNVKFACIFQSRFKPDYLKLKSAIEDGKLGKLILGNAYIKWFRSEDYYAGSNWRGTMKGDGGAALINQGIHTIDLLLSLMGDVKSIVGKVKTTLHDIEGEDLGVAILDFQNGATGVIEGSTALYPGYPERLEIYGEHGSVILEGGKITSWNLKGDTTKASSPQESDSGSSDPMSISYKYHKLQLSDFVESIIHDKKPLITGEEGRPALEVIKTIYKSSESNREIEL
ncbi:Gfo/Idh/MocA family protein [Membranihabitans maritimus]|uniref:Gfo/Idh/MocA family protein n=1 Tax=Membranihabitans maritimus TaxID=2904244 RepID=UPI001F2F5D67|nr:Gfo/Idh/MocA family oxidoreductase [Membranihabitans maritimus]